VRKKPHHYWLSQPGTILAVVTNEVRNEEAKIPYDDLASDRIHVFRGLGAIDISFWYGLKIAIWLSAR
jgi:hypothetical protein